MKNLIKKMKELGKKYYVHVYKAFILQKIDTSTLA